MPTIARLLVAAVLLTACGSGAGVASEQDLADLEATVEEVANLCGDQDQDRARDRDRLRDLTGDQTRDRLRDQDMDRFLDDCEGLAVRESDVTVDGDEAIVRVRYRARGRSGEGDCDFRFARGDDGRWGLRELPGCPL
ncbi:MAG: hypothetical protein AB1Z55_08790, partial [Acidimicrobiia bacterium]